MLFHDYSPAEVWVYNNVNLMAERLGRKPDILIVDSNLVGMAGLVKQVGDGAANQ